MSAQYDEGRRQALESLGLRPKTQDNPLVSKFVSSLEESKDSAPGKGNRPLHRQSWGKAVEYSTSNQDFSGGGVQR